MPSILGVILSAVLGLIIGSFLGAYSHRVLKGGSALRGRSECPHCHKTLTARDLVPVLSYIWLGGRCRRCRKPIGIGYLLIEFGAALGFIGAYLFTQPMEGWVSTLRLGWLWYLLAVGIVIVVVDLKAQIIPNRVLGLASLVTLAYGALLTISGGMRLELAGVHILSALVAGGFFLSLSILSRGRWMGGGDIKLFALIGLILGWPGTVVALLLALWSGAAVSLILIAGGRKKMKSLIPFGPFLVLGAGVALIWAEQIIQYYIRAASSL